MSSKTKIGLYEFSYPEPMTKVCPTCGLWMRPKVGCAVCKNKPQPDPKR